MHFYVSPAEDKQRSRSSCNTETELLGDQQFAERNCRARRATAFQFNSWRARVFEDDVHKLIEFRPRFSGLPYGTDISEAPQATLTMNFCFSEALFFWHEMKENRYHQSGLGLGVGENTQFFVGFRGGTGRTHKNSKTRRRVMKKQWAHISESGYSTVIILHFSRRGLILMFNNERVLLVGLVCEWCEVHFSYLNFIFFGITDELSVSIFSPFIVDSLSLFYCCS